MSFLRFMTIACLAVALLITIASNLTPELPLVFLGRSTVPISLGWLVLGAFSAGITTSLILRVLMFWQQPRKQRATTPADFSYEPSPASDNDWETSRDQYEREPNPPSRRRPERSIAPEPDSAEQFKYAPPSDSVYDANYRVISQPNTGAAVPPPVVGSKLPSDSEDWGFDFEDEDAPKA